MAVEPGQGLVTSQLMINVMCGEFKRGEHVTVPGLRELRDDRVDLAPV